MCKLANNGWVELDSRDIKKVNEFKDNLSYNQAIVIVLWRSLGFLFRRYKGGARMKDGSWGALPDEWFFIDSKNRKIKRRMAYNDFFGISHYLSIPDYPIESESQRAKLLDHGIGCPRNCSCRRNEKHLNSNLIVYKSRV